MENKNSNSNDYKHQCNKLENFEDEKFYDKYETQNEENDNFTSATIPSTDLAFYLVFVFLF